MARKRKIFRQQIPLNFWIILIAGVLALHVLAQILTQVLLLLCAVLAAISTFCNWIIGWISGVTQAFTEVTTWQTNCGLIGLHITLGCLVGFALGLRAQKPSVRAGDEGVTNFVAGYKTRAT